MSRPLLCKLGVHKPDPERYIKVERRHWPSKKKYHRNYIVCQRCGRLLRPFAIQKIGGPAMSDYIKREDAIAAVDKYLDSKANGADVASDLISDITCIPAAPVREVVTCGECVHLGIKDFATGYCNGGPMCGVVKPWDYCSHGVRKADMRAEEGGAT